MRQFTRARRVKGMAGRLAGDQRGTPAIEYALIASAIAALIAATVYVLGGETVRGLYDQIASIF